MKKFFLGNDVRLTELRRGASAAFVIQVGGAGLALAIQVLLARSLGVEGFGQYAFVISWVNLLGPLAVLGIGDAALRFIPAYRANGEFSKMRGISRFSVLSVTCVSLGAMGIMQIVVWLNGGLGIASRTMMTIGLLIIPFVALLTLTGGLLRGLKEITQSLSWNAIIRPLFFLLLFAVTVLILGKSITPAGALLMNLVAAGLALFGVAVVTTRRWPREVRFGARVYDKKNWFSVGAALLVVAIMQIVLNRVDVIMLGSLSDAREAGAYYAAARLANLALFGLTAVNQILAPMIAEHYYSGDMTGLQRLLTIAARFTLGLTVILTVILAILGPSVLGLFGKEFIAALPVVYVLLAGNIISAASGSVGYLMSMTRFHKEAAVFYIGAGALAILMNLLLIPHFGALGAAFSMASALILRNIFTVVYVRIKLGLNTTIFRWKTLSSFS